MKINKPYENYYCDKCIYIDDGDCKKLNYCPCGAVIQCNNFIEGVTHKEETK